MTGFPADKTSVRAGRYFAEPEDLLLLFVLPKIKLQFKDLDYCWRPKLDLVVFHGTAPLLWKRKE